MLPGSARRVVPFSSKEDPLYTLQQELCQQTLTLAQEEVCLSGNPAVIIDPKTISKVVKSSKDAEVLVQALARSVIAEALVYEVADKISSKELQA